MVITKQKLGGDEQAQDKKNEYNYFIYKFKSATDVRMAEFFLIEVYLIYNISGAQQSDSVIYIYIYIYIYILFQILFHCRLLQHIEYSSLCYTVGLCCLSILYTVVCIC